MRHPLAAAESLAGCRAHTARGPDGPAGSADPCHAASPAHTAAAQARLADASSPELALAAAHRARIAREGRASRRVLGRRVVDTVERGPERVVTRRHGRGAVDLPLPLPCPGWRPGSRFHGGMDCHRDATRGVTALHGAPPSRPGPSLGPKPSSGLSGRYLHLPDFLRSLVRRRRSFRCRGLCCPIPDPAPDGTGSD